MILLLFVAAAAEEPRQYRVAKASFGDGLYEVAERQLAEYLTAFPNTGHADELQLMLGQAQLNQGKWREAVLTLQQALARWPAEKRPDSFRFWLAEALVRGEKFSEAEKLYADVVEKYPRSAYRPQAQYGLAYVQFKLHRPEAAIQTLGKLPKPAPKGELAQNGGLLRGQIYLAMANFARADEVFRELIEQYPDSRTFYRAQYWAGESLAGQGKYAESLAHFQVVSDRFQGGANKLVDAEMAAEAWYATGWAYWQQNRFDEAAGAFTQSLANARSAAVKRDAMLKLAESYTRGGKREQGVAQLRAFLDAQPADPLADEIQWTIGKLQWAREDYGAALAAYGELITKYPQSALLGRAHFEAGWACWKLNKLADALPHFQQAFALARDPAVAAEALFKVADTQFALGQYADAMGGYQRLISAYPETKLIDRAMSQLGQVYQRVRNPEAAISVYESLARQYPQSRYAPEALFSIGLIQVGQLREPEARTAFGELIAKYPNTEWSRKAALATGESWRREGNMEQAIAVFDRLAGEADRATADQAAYSRGWCYAASGQADKTLAEFTKFLQEHPDSAQAPDLRYWVGDYYWKRDDYLKAQEQFQLLAKNYPASKLADTALHSAARAAYARQDYAGAIDLFESLVKTYAESPWRCDARFGQGDAMSELGRFDDALLVFDSLIKEFPACSLGCEAQGRKGDCQFTLGRYPDAIVSYRNALGCATRSERPDSSLINQIYYKLGQSYERNDRLNDAFEQYSKAVYEAVAGQDTNAPPERFWICKAALAATGVKEKQEQWREAIAVYQRLGELCPEMKPLTEERIRKIRVEHFLLY